MLKEECVRVCVGGGGVGGGGVGVVIEYSQNS